MIKWFSLFRHGDPADYEAWFEDLAEEGWQPKKIGVMSAVGMSFEKTEPKKMKYTVDLRLKPDLAYLAEHRRLGWEYAGRMSGFFVWRKPYEDKKPESFTDSGALYRMVRRFMIVSAVLLGIFLAAFFALAIIIQLTYHDLSQIQFLKCLIGLAVSGIMSACFGLLVMRLAKHRPDDECNDRESAYNNR